jgi:hypothetical protein
MVCHRNGTSWFTPQAGKVIPCKCAHWLCLTVCRNFNVPVSLFRCCRHLPGGRAESRPSVTGLVFNTADTSAPGITGIRRLFSLRKLYILLSFLQCSSRAGIFLQHRPIACEKTRIRQALPGKPELP